MKELDQILDENDNVYVWGDGSAIDICNYNKDISLYDYVIKYECLACETPLIKGNQKFVSRLNDAVKGIKLTCTNCHRTHFIHQKLTIDEATKTDVTPPTGKTQ